MHNNVRLVCALWLAWFLSAASAMPPVTIVDQGSFATGGTVIAAK